MSIYGYDIESSFNPENPFENLPESLDDGSYYDDGEDRYLGDGDDEYYHVSEAPSE